MCYIDAPIRLPPSPYPSPLARALPNIFISPCLMSGAPSTYRQVARKAMSRPTGVGAPPG
eukprot:scaffold95827_cov25-Tisochrysis_lutea.AAC.5